MLLLAIAAFTRWQLLLYIIDLALVVILVVKLSQAILELRKYLWHPITISAESTVGESLRGRGYIIEGKQ